jgi:hypothetical protein
MRFRARLVIGAVVALAFVAVAGHVDLDATSASTPSKHEVVSAPTAPTSLSSVRAPRPLGRGGLPDAALPATLFALAAGLLAVGVRARRARRITDAGGDWRSLLLGAPPATTCC